MSGQDINFDSHERFSKSYLLRGEDEDEIRKTFTDAVLSFYENQTGISTEAGRDQLIFYRAGKRIKAEEVVAFLKEGSSVFKLFR